MPSIHRFLPSGGESLNIMYDLYMCHPLRVWFWSEKGYELCPWWSEIGSRKGRYNPTKNS